MANPHPPRHTTRLPYNHRMSILTHGSDLRLAPTLSPLVAATDGTVRGALLRLAAMKFQAVQLDATLSGIRPRELSGRARKDLLALLSRQGMQLAGLDLFLPRHHLLAGEHVDRAMAAVLAAIELAADLGRVPLSLALPVEQLPDDQRSTLVEAAAGRDVRLAVHAEDQIEALTHWLAAVDQPVLGAGIDPAALIARGEKPVRTTQRLAPRLCVARLSDVTSGALRCPIGAGELELSAYRITVDLATARTGPIVLDLRGLEAPITAAQAAQAAWDRVAFIV